MKYENADIPKIDRLSTIEFVETLLKDISLDDFLKLINLLSDIEDNIIEFKNSELNKFKPT